MDADFKEKVRAASDIVEVLGERLRDLQRSGSCYKARCPFHDDAHPSLVVWPSSQTWCCFGCGKGGDVFSFVMEHDGQHFGQAVAHLAKRAGIDVPGKLGDHGEERIDLRHRVLDLAAHYYHQQLMENQDVLNYLEQERDLRRETLQEYLVGWCDGSKRVEEYILGKLQNRTAEEVRSAIRASGLIETPKDSDEEYEYFRGCITFPYLKHGKAVYMTGRGYPKKKNLKLKRERLSLECLYLEDHPFHREVILDEGEIDTLTLRQAGFTGRQGKPIAYGVPGVSSFKKEWVSKLARAGKVYLAFDGDHAGREAALTLAGLIGTKARIVSMPEGKDVNDFFQAGEASDFDNLIEQAQTAISVRVHTIDPALRSRDRSDAITGILKELAPLGHVEAEGYLAELKEQLGLSSEELSACRKDLKGCRKDVKEAHKEEESSTGEVADMKEISPAQHFTEERAYFAVPSFRMTPQGPVEEIWVISSDRERFLLIPSELVSRKLYSTREPSPSPRWSIKSQEEFLRGEPPPGIEDTFRKIKRLFDRHIEFLEPRTSTLMAVWVVGSYFHRIFTTYPYIHLRGEMESGKTKTLKLTAALSFNGELTVNSTPAYVTRSVHSNHSTCCVDEAERLSRRDEDAQTVISLFNAGYCKGTYVGKAESRGVEQRWEPVRFEAYSPKMFASIKSLAPVLHSRCIPITMVRSADEHITNSIVNLEAPELQTTRDYLYHLAMTHFAEVRKAFQELRDPEIAGREWELWRPLLAVAVAICGETGHTALYDELRGFALDSIHRKREDDEEGDKARRFLKAIGSLVRTKPANDDFYPIPVVGDFLREYDPEGFGWLQPEREGYYIGNRLRKLALVEGSAKQRRVEGGQVRGYVVRRVELEKRLKAFKLPSVEQDETLPAVASVTALQEDVSAYAAAC